MTLDSAAQDLCSDLNMLQARMLMEGWPVRARVLNCGTVGAPGRGPTGIFTRFDCNGEQYVFTVTGPTRSMEAYLSAAHENLSRLLAAHWPARDVAESDLRDLMRQWRDGEAHTSAGYDEQELDPRVRRHHQRTLMHQHEFSVQRRPDGLWTACVTIPTAQGNIRLCATADEHAIAQALHSELSDVSGRPWTRSEHFRSASAAVAEDRVLDRLGAAMRSMVRDPGVQSVFSSIVPFVPVVGPPAALAFKGAEMAMNINDKLQQGDPGTTAKVRQVANLAKQGNVKAKLALKALMFARDAAKDQALKTKDERILKLEAENKELQIKLATCETKWKEKPMEAADDYIDMFGGSDDYVGPDMVKAAGVVMGKEAEDVSGLNPILARPLVASYYMERLPDGDRQKRNGSPEVGALYHRPMREASSASMRQAYLRGDALERTDFRTDQHPGTRELIPGWGRRAAGH